MLLIDTSQAALQDARRNIEGIVAEGVRRAKITQADAERSLARINARTEMTAVLKETKVEVAA